MANTAQELAELTALLNTPGLTALPVRVIITGQVPLEAEGPDFLDIIKVLLEPNELRDLLQFAPREWWQESATLVQAVSNSWLEVVPADNSIVIITPTPITPTPTTVKTAIEGDMLVFTDGEWNRLAPGPDNTVITSNGPGISPTYQASGLDGISAVLPIVISGGLSPVVSMAASGVVAGIYGSSTQTFTIEVTDKGVVKSIGTVAISGVPPGGTAGGVLTGTYPNPGLANDAVATSNIVNSAVTSGKLAVSGVVAGVYGSSTSIPVLTVSDRGLITIASSSPFNIGASAVGGDLSGQVDNATVIKLQNRALSSTAPTADQVLSWNNVTSVWEPVSFTAGAGLQLIGHEYSVPTGGITTTLIADGAVIKAKISITTAEVLAENDPATKGYVDTVAAGLHIRASVHVKDDTGTPLSGLRTIDGHTVLDGDRVFVCGPNLIQRGIYVAHAAAWDRAADYAVGSDVHSTFFFVQVGDTYADTSWVCVNNQGSAVVGTDPLEYTQFGGATVYTAGPGLQLIGTEFSIATNGVLEGMIDLNAVTESKIKDGAVTVNKIPDTTVTQAKLNLSAPTLPNHAVTLSYADGRYVNVTGDTMSGVLSFESDLTHLVAVTLDPDAATAPITVYGAGSTPATPDNGYYVQVLGNAVRANNEHTRFAELNADLLNLTEINDAIPEKASLRISVENATAAGVPTIKSMLGVYGTISVVDGFALTDNRGFTINDGINPPTTFTYRLGLPSSGTTVGFELFDSYITVLQNTVLAINGVAGLDLEAEGVLLNDRLMKLVPTIIEVEQVEVSTDMPLPPPSPPSPPFTVESSLVESLPIKFISSELQLSGAQAKDAADPTDPQDLTTKLYVDDLFDQVLTAITAELPLSVTPGVTPVISLLNSGVTPFTYGGSGAVPRFTVDAKGRILSVVEVPIGGVSPGGVAGGSLGGTYPNPNIAPGAVSTNELDDGGVTEAKLDPVLGLVEATYGSSSRIPALKVGTKGRILEATDYAINTSALAVGGDLEGTVASATVVNIQNRPVVDVGPTLGQALVWNGSAWTPAAQANASAPYVVITNDPGLPNERALATALGEITLTDGGAGANVTLGLANTAATPGVYGDFVHIPIVTVDAKGRITSISQTPVAGGDFAPGSAKYITFSATASAALPNERVLVVSSDFTKTEDSLAKTVTLALTTVPATPAIYGSSTSIPQITISATGRVTQASNAGLDVSGQAVGSVAGHVSGTIGNITVPVGGDLSAIPLSTGGPAHAMVSRLLQRPLSATVPASGDSLVWNGTAWEPQSVSLTNLVPDPSGTYGSSTAFAAVTVDSKGRVTAASSTSLGGDIASPFNNTEVIALRHRAIAVAAPSVGDVYAWTGTEWEPQNVALSDITLGGTFGLASITVDTKGRVTSSSEASLAGDVTGTKAATVVEKIRGTSVSASAPTLGQALVFDGSVWKPTTSPASAAPAALQYLVLANDPALPLARALTLETVNDFAPTDGGGGSTYNIALKATGVTPATYGDSTHVAAFAVDSKGRITSASEVAIDSSNFPIDGDVTGELTASPKTTVVKIQNRAVSSAAPSAGAVLYWKTSPLPAEWTPSTGTSNITLGTVNSVTVENHHDRHQPGGADALPTAAPSIGIGAANSEGTATTLARSDHNHKLRTGSDDLAIGAIADGQFVKRVDNDLVGVSITPGASARVLTGNFTGTLSTSLAANARWYPPNAVTLSRAWASLGEAAGGVTEFDVLMNGVSVLSGPVSISPGGFRSVDLAIASVVVGITNYLTLSLTTANGGANATVFVEYT